MYALFAVIYFKVFAIWRKTNGLYPTEVVEESSNHLA
jgi:hypothetical protein